MTIVLDALKRVAACTIGDDEQSREQMNAWQWGQGVALYALTKTYEHTKDERLLDYIEQWLDRHLQEEPPGYSINTTAPVLAALRWMALTDSSKYRELCANFAEWCVSGAPRSVADAYEHSCTENVYPNQIWADTLFMGCIFLAEWGAYTGDPSYTRESARQFVLHYHYLADPVTGLIYHGYSGNEGEQMGVLWGRGNGWFTAASAIVLPHFHGLPEYGKVLANYERHAEGAIGLQHPSGFWHTVMDDPDTYLESSVTASFAFGLNAGIRSGLLKADPFRSYARQAVQALLDDLDAQGRVRHGSGGTCVMPSAVDYDAIPFRYTAFTQGLAMLALCGELSLGAKEEEGALR